MRRMITAAVTLAAFAIAGVATAQGLPNNDFTPVNVTVRGGVALPLDNTLTNLGNNLIDLGVEYQFPESLINNSGETYFSLDYWVRGITFGKGSVVPVMINQRWYTGGGALRRSYFFLGAGVDFIDVDTSNAAVGLRGGIGQELGEHIIAEICGCLSDRAGNARADGITFSIGYRF